MANGNTPERDETPAAPAQRAEARGRANIPQAPVPARNRPPVRFDPDAPIPPVQRHGPGRIRHGFRLRYLALIAATLAGGYYLYDKLQHDAFLAAAGAEAHAKTEAMVKTIPYEQLPLSGKVERRGNKLFITLDETHRPVDQSEEYFPVSLEIVRYYDNALFSAEVVATVDRNKTGADPVRYSFHGDNLISVDFMKGTGPFQWDATGTLIRE